MDTSTHQRRRLTFALTSDMGVPRSTSFAEPEPSDTITRSTRRSISLRHGTLR